MHIFISGVGGAGLSSIAHLCLDLGYRVTGSDIESNSTIEALIQRGLRFQLRQEAKFIDEINQINKIDYYIHTPALKADNPEKLQAQKLNIKSGTHNFMILQILQTTNMKLVAVAGTHGKTTTTAMIVWLLRQLNLSVSYIIGSEISFGNGGQYQAESQFFVYEADEYDRKFLQLYPDIAVITSIDYDHPDTYSKQIDYNQAFHQFITQSKTVISFENDPISQNLTPLKNINHSITLFGQHNKSNAQLALETVLTILKSLNKIDYSTQDLINHLNTFPGTARRFEKISDFLYSDYAHHPTEIRATLQLTTEFISKKQLNSKIVVVYQPHQNTRQHQLKHDYIDCFNLADKIYWLPTYLTRENPDLDILTGKDLVKNSQFRTKVKFVDFNDELWQKIHLEIQQQNLVLLMGAGDIDTCFRKNLTKILNN